jgi:hypothetical protein
MDDYSYDEEPTYETPGPGYPPPPDVLDSLNDLGSTILDKVNDAVDAADFRGLSSTVSDAIRTTATSISSSFSQPSTAIVRASGKHGGAIARMVAHGWGAGMCGIMTLGGLGSTLGDFSIMSAILTGVFASLTALFVGKFKKANADRKMHKALDQYARIAGTREQVSVEELASKTGASFNDAVANVTLAIDEGYIPHGRIRGTADGLTTLFLTDRAFAAAGGRDPRLSQQRTSERIAGRRHETPAQPATTPVPPQSAAPAPQPKPQAEQAKQQGDAADMDPRVRDVVKEGNSYIERIHRANDVIEEQEMSDKLDHLEGVVRRIITGARERPETVGQLGQFMSYYLPTTGKLVDAYAELDAHGDHGPNAEATRAEIKSTLDVINASFDKLADDLLQDTAWDLASDMRVLRTMLTQDGLADDGGPRADENRFDFSPFADDDL